MISRSHSPPQATVRRSIPDSTKTAVMAQPARLESRAALFGVLYMSHSPVHRLCPKDDRGGGKTTGAGKFSRYRIFIFRHSRVAGNPGMPGAALQEPYRRGSGADAGFP